MTAYYAKTPRGYAEAYRDAWRWAMRRVGLVRLIWSVALLPGSPARRTIDTLRNDALSA